MLACYGLVSGYAQYITFRFYMQTFVRFCMPFYIKVKSFTFHKMRTHVQETPTANCRDLSFMGFYEILHHKLLKLSVSIPTRKLLHYIHRSDPS